MTKEELGQRLKEIRESKGITCTDVVRDLKFGNGTDIAAYEYGVVNARMDRILQYVQYLNSVFIITDGVTNEIISDYSSFIDWVCNIMKQRNMSRYALAVCSKIPQTTLQGMLSYHRRIYISNALGLIDALNFDCVIQSGVNYRAIPVDMPVCTELTLTDFGNLVCALNTSSLNNKTMCEGLTPISNKHLENGTGRVKLAYAILYLNNLQHVIALRRNDEEFLVNSYNEFVIWAKSVRKSLGLSAGQASWKVGTSNPLVSNFESGRTTLTLAAFLKVIAAYGATLSIIKK